MRQHRRRSGQEKREAPELLGNFGAKQPQSADTHGVIATGDSTTASRHKKEHVDHLSKWFAIRKDYTAGELIKLFDVDALKQYLAEELSERWPDQIIDKYGLDTVQEILSDLVETHGPGLRDGIDNPAGYFRWVLAQSLPKTTKYLDGHRNRFANAAEADLQAEANARSLF